MNNQVNCSNCSQALVYADEHAGQKLQCPKCKALVSTPAKAQPAAAQEKRLGNYLIQGELGRGGMGAVYLALDTALNRRVALKVLNSKLGKNQTYVERFLRESRSAAALQHPNIVTALDVGNEGGHYFFAMELVEGQNLRKLLQQQGAVTEVRALEIAVCIAMALQHAWRKNIVHRDIKPDNIMIAKDGTVKLTDMGLAKATDNSDATLTQAGVMIGSPHYASPEQIRGETDVDCRTDIYSLGISLYHMVAGVPPFQGETAGLVTAKQLAEPLPDPRQFKPYLSAHFCQLLQKMTAKDRDRRFQTPDELFDAIQQVRAGTAPAQAAAPISARIAARAVSTPQAVRRQRSASLLPLGFAAMFLMTAGAVYFYMSGNKSQPVQTPAPIVVRKSDPAAEKASQAQADYARAERFADSHPEEFAKVIGQFQEVWPVAAGTPAEATVLAAIDKWKKKWHESAEAEFNATKVRADSLVQGNDIEGAFAVWKGFPVNLNVPGISSRISAETGSFQKTETDGFQKTETVVESVATDPEKSGTVPSQLEASLKDYRQVMESLAPLLEERNWSSISTVTGKLLEDERTEPMRAFLLAFRSDIEAAQSLTSVERIKSSIGKSLRFAGIESKVVDVTDTEIKVQTAAGELSKPLLKMRAKDFFELQGLDSETATEKDLLAVGILSFMEGKYNDAAEFFALLQSPSQTAYQDVRRFKAEVEAEEKIVQLRTAVESSDYRKIIAIVKTLSADYAQTEVAKINAAFVEGSKDAALAGFTARARETEELVAFAEEKTKLKRKELEEKYEAEKEKIRIENAEAMTDPTGYVLEQESNYSKQRINGNPAPRVKGGSAESGISSEGGRSSQKIINYVSYNVVRKTGESINKSANAADIARMLDRGDLEEESYSLLKSELKRLKSQILAINRKYENFSASLVRGVRARLSSIETHSKRTILQIKEGKITTQDDVEANLNKSD